MVIAAEWSKANTIGKITDEQFIECIKQRCVRQENGENLYLVQNAVKKVLMKMRILGAQDRVWSLHQNYGLAMEAAEYGSRTEHKATTSILHNLAGLHSLISEVLNEKSSTAG